VGVWWLWLDTERWGTAHLHTDSLLYQRRPLCADVDVQRDGLRDLLSPAFELVPDGPNLVRLEIELNGGRLGPTVSWWVETGAGPGRCGCKSRPSPSGLARRGASAATAAQRGRAR